MRSQYEIEQDEREALEYTKRKLAQEAHDRYTLRYLKALFEPAEDPDPERTE